MFFKLFICIYFVFIGGVLNFNSSYNCDLKKPPTNVLEYSWVETDSSVALLKDSKVIWQLNHNTTNNKPYFYPLKTTNGDNLVWLRPKDHPWHYGLWFSWKYINGINFWEEDKQTHLSEGKQEVRDLSVELLNDFSAIIKYDICYLSKNDQDMLHEQRIINISALDEKGSYYIDWSLYFKTDSQKVILDRTPPKQYGGPVYGGYAGLSYRASSEMKDHIYLDSEKRIYKSEIIGEGKKAKWMDLSATVNQNGNQAGITMFNHPQNEGEKNAPWYIYKERDFSFYNAALLFDLPKEIKPHHALKLNYRVLIHNDILTHEELEAQYKIYKQSIIIR